MGSRSQMTKLENLFCRSWKTSSTSVPASRGELIIINYIMNVVQIKGHISSFLSWCSSLKSFDITVLQNIKGVIVRREITITTNPNILLDFKVNHDNIKHTIAII
jgi:hypothetical protein